MKLAKCVELPVQRLVLSEEATLAQRISSEDEMSQFSDLTPYTYRTTSDSEVGARNVGWLGAGNAYPTTSSIHPQFVGRLWRYCKVSLVQTRGLHECELCCSRDANVARHDGEELLLGSAEIRVFGSATQIYAAPNLIFHYVVSHQYSPPTEFVRAVLEEPCPPENGYFKLLDKLRITWSNTLVPEPGSKSFRFVKTPDGVVKVEE